MGYPDARSPAVSSDLLWAGAATLAALLAGGVVGLGNPMLALVVAGTLAGVALIAYPRALLWLALLYSLVGIGLLNAVADLDKADWLLSAAMAAFWPVTVFALLRPGAAARPPSFVAWLGVFYLLALGVSLVRVTDLTQLVIGIRNYVVMFGLVLALSFAQWRPEAVRAVAVGVLAIGVLQLPVTLYQYLFVRAFRVATGGFRGGDSAIEASDSVFGTMGGFSLTYGLDDLLALVLCTVLAGVLALYRQRALSRGRTIALAAALGVPLFLSENKVIVVFVPLLVLVVFGRDLVRNPLRLAAGAIGIVLFVPVAVLAYFHIHWSSQYDDIEQALEKMTEYTFKPMTQTQLNSGDMSRADALTYWADNQRLEDPTATLFGHGMAASKWASGMTQPRLVTQHGNRRLDKSGLSMLLWDVGVLGTLAFLWALVAAVRTGGRVAGAPGLAPADRAIVKAAQVCVLLALLSLPLKATLLTWAQATFVLFLALALIAYYARLVGRTSATRRHAAWPVRTPLGA